VSTAKRRGNHEGSTPVKRADGRWQVHVRYRDEHGVRQRTTVYGKTPREARDKAEEVRRRLRAHLPAKDKKITLGAFAESWITSTLAASDRKPSTKSLYATLARKHIIGAKLGAQPLDRLKPSHVEAWKVELKGRGLSDSTIRSAFNALKAILDTAVRDEALARNVATSVTRPKATRYEAAFLTPEEVRRLLEAASATRHAALFAFLVNTALRRGEALALRWSDVNLDARVLRVRGTLARFDGTLIVTEPKTTKSRRSVPLSAAVERVLREVRTIQAADRLRAGSAWQQTGYVFTTQLGEPCDPRNVLRALKAVAKRAGLGDIGLHTLRHSAAAVMLVNGVPLKVVSEVLGHASIGITGDIYGHVSPDVSREALGRLSEALG
jgi:integrase